VDESLLKPRETIDPYLFEISHIIRKYIQKHMGMESFEKEFRWAEKLSRKVDDFIGQIDNEDCEYAADLVEKIRKSIEAREVKNEIQAKKT
jgi:vacuolar-type H+-ATPase subunit I/STV1